MRYVLLPDEFEIHRDKMKGWTKDLIYEMDRLPEQLYAFTSDEGGIRHSLEEDSIPIDFHDAKFMLIACTAFINYVNGKLE